MRAASRVCSDTGLPGAEKKERSVIVLAYAAGIVSLVCWIMVLIKMFEESVVQGIIGIICSLWAFIWGWMNVEKNQQKNIMLIWTAAIIVALVVQFAFGASMMPTTT